jgi:predicted O-linked N-acetylglucosamine transferase (SPINDLY family)
MKGAGMSLDAATDVLSRDGLETFITDCFRSEEALASLHPQDDAALGAALRGLDAARVTGLAAALPRDRAIALYKSWLAFKGRLPEAFAVWFNLGVLLMERRNAAEAATAYRNALELRPATLEAVVNLGLCLESLGQTADAIRTWRQALPPAPMRGILHTQLARTLEEKGELREAVAELEAALFIEPDQPDLQQHWVHMRQRMAIWPAAASPFPSLPTTALEKNCGPLAALALYDDPVRQREITAAWIARKAPPPRERLAPPAGYAHDRIRLGYLSSDFCRHSVSFLMAEVLERHDRSAFEVYGYCSSRDDGSAIRQRVLGALDHHVPIRSFDDEAAARRIREDEIDILVDLNGLTKGARLGVLRWTPAPVQVSYLGFIGSVPLPELDWMLCDEITVPPERLADYAPRPLWIEGCYQANDGTPRDLPRVTREEEGLPAGAFVFACFSHHYKITPEMFGAWLDILGGAANAVLWLVDDGAESRRNLAARWQAHGLAPERLVFAPRVAPERYRARMALADLFLDTAPFNAGTVASDALRMGLPLLTLQGQAFAGRMASSLLAAMDLRELIATSLPEYVALATRIARDPGRYRPLRARVSARCWERTLGDAAGFTRRLEAALTSVRLCPA